MLSELGWVINLFRNAYFLKRNIYSLLCCIYNEDGQCILADDGGKEEYSSMLI